MSNMKPNTNTSEYAKSNMIRDTPEAVATWLEPIKWSAISTLTLPYSATSTDANARFDAMINSLERSMRMRVGYVRSCEYRSKFGGQVSRHFHCALVAAKPIDCNQVSDAWSALLGKRSGSNSEYALTEPYVAGIGGLQYIAKQIAADDSDWDLRNIEHFDSRLESTPTGRGSLRAARRLQDQANGNQSVRKVVEIKPVKTGVVISAAPSIRMVRTHGSFGCTLPLAFPPRPACIVSPSHQTAA